MAFIGLILLAGPENNLLALGVGEMITLASALAIAAEIILISAWAGKVDVPPGDGRATGDRVAGGFRRHEAGG